MHDNKARSGPWRQLDSGGVRGQFNMCTRALAYPQLHSHAVKVALGRSREIGVEGSEQANFAVRRIQWALVVCAAVPAL